MLVGERSGIQAVRKAKLKSWGTSQGVRIPKPVCAWAGIGQDDDLRMEIGSDGQGRYILLRPDRADGHRHYGASAAAVSLDGLFGAYSGDFAPRELDWGPDVGSEVVE